MTTTDWLIIALFSLIGAVGVLSKYASTRPNRKWLLGYGVCLLLFAIVVAVPVALWLLFRVCAERIKAYSKKQ